MAVEQIRLPAMTAMLRFSGVGKRDPVIEEWLAKTDALTAIARIWFIIRDLLPSQLQWSDCQLK